LTKHNNLFFPAFDPIGRDAPLGISQRQLAAADEDRRILKLEQMF